MTARDVVLAGDELQADGLAVLLAGDELGDQRVDLRQGFVTHPDAFWRPAEPAFPSPALA